MTFFSALLLVFLIGCAIASTTTKKIISSVIIFMSYSVVMSILWLILQSPDLALTEAAVGAGITSVLFLLVIRRINMIGEKKDGE